MAPRAPTRTGGAGAARRRRGDDCDRHRASPLALLILAASQVFDLYVDVSSAAAPTCRRGATARSPRRGRRTPRGSERGRCPRRVAGAVAAPGPMFVLVLLSLLLVLLPVPGASDVLDNIYIHI